MTRMFAIGSAVRWHTRRVEAERAAIQDEVGRVAESQGTEQALSHCLERIEGLATDDGPVGQLRRLIYVIGALTLDAQFGGLKAQQISRLFNLAEAILKTENIQRGTSRLAFFHGELHDLKSRRHGRVGEHWLAAWELGIASYATGSEVEADEHHRAYLLILAAERALRLGQGARALLACEQAEASSEWHLTARLLRIRLLRLCGNAVGAEALALASDGLSWSTTERLDLEWEHACRVATGEQDLAPMTRLVQTGATHHAPRYVLEHQLWARSTNVRRFEDKLASVAYLMRKKGFKGVASPLMFETALTFEALYDYAIPVEVRRERLGPLLARTDELPSLDWALLAWAAAARWLARSHFFPLAALALGQYQSLSLMLSSGTHADALGIAQDLFSRDWYTGAAKEARDTSFIPFRIAE